MSAMLFIFEILTDRINSRLFYFILRALLLFQVDRKTNKNLFIKGKFIERELQFIFQMLK